jgi:hypothetical protein
MKELFRKYTDTILKKMIFLAIIIPIFILIVTIFKVLAAILFLVGFVLWVLYMFAYMWNGFKH